MMISLTVVLKTQSFEKNPLKCLIWIFTPKIYSVSQYQTWVKNGIINPIPIPIPFFSGMKNGI